MGTSSTLVTVTGRDAPGISGRLFAAIAPLHLEVLDVEQVQIRGTLILCVELGGDLDAVGRPVHQAVEEAFATEALRVELSRVEEAHRSGEPHLVTMLAPDIRARSMAFVFGHLAAVGANVDRIRRLSTYPVTSYELTVSGTDGEVLRRAVGAIAAEGGLDIAVQRMGLHRRARHLVVLDADSTLLQGEVIDALAARAGRGLEVSAITVAAMAGELEFAASLRRRVALLAGLEAGVLDEVAGALVLAPGARTLVRTLKRLGYATAVVSGGFHQVIRPLVDDLEIDYLAANTLEVVDGRLTGRVVGDIVDRPGKADALARFAADAGVPLVQTIAIGDGSNDLDMLAAAGLGIAFNAKPAVRRAADAALNVPFLDAVLFFLGVSRDEIEAADLGE